MCRKHQRELTTGSAPCEWPYFEAIGKFLGSLPINDASLIEESGAQSGATVEEARMNFLFCTVSKGMSDVLA